MANDDRAPTDANRKRVIEHPASVKPVVAALSSAQTSVIASIVLNNVITDYGTTSYSHYTTA